MAKKISKSELANLIKEIADPIINDGEPLEQKMNQLDREDNSDGSAYVKVSESGKMEKKTAAPVDIPKEFDAESEPTEQKMNQKDSDQGHDEEIAAAAKIEGSKQKKKGTEENPFIEGQAKPDVESKKDQPKVSEKADPTQEGGKPGGKENEPKMNTEDEAGSQSTEEVTKTMITPGEDLNKGFSKGQKKVDSHVSAQNEKEPQKPIADAIQLPENFKSKKEMLDFIKTEARRVSKLL